MRADGPPEAAARSLTPAPASTLLGALPGRLDRYRATLQTQGAHRRGPPRSWSALLAACERAEAGVRRRRGAQAAELPRQSAGRLVPGRARRTAARRAPPTPRAASTCRNPGGRRSGQAPIPEPRPGPAKAPADVGSRSATPGHPRPQRGGDSVSRRSAPICAHDAGAQLLVLVAWALPGSGAVSRCPPISPPPGRKRQGRPPPSFAEADTTVDGSRNVPAVVLRRTWFAAHGSRIALSTIAMILLPAV